MTKPLTVCFDLRCLQIGHENRGVGMHAKSILEHLTPGHDNRYIFYVFDKNDPIKELSIKLNVEYTLVSTPTTRMSVGSPRDFLRLLKIINHKFHPLRNYQPDIFIQFDFMLGSPKWSDTKNILIAYDLIPLILRSTYIPNIKQSMASVVGIKLKIKKAIRAVYYQWRYSMHYKEFRKATTVISISDDTKRSLIKYLGISDDKIHTIPLAPAFSSSKKTVKSIFKAIPTPYLFYIGATDERKRVQDLVAAFNILKGRGYDINLVLAGNEFKKVDKIPNLEIRNAIINSSYRENIYTFGYVNDTEKIELYKNAFAFVFPTTYEGFGLPIIEAMVQGCPVVSYNNSSIPEVASNKALLVETGNVIALTSAITDLISNSSKRNQLIKEGVNHAQQFTWDRYMDHFQKCLEDTVNNPNDA